MARFGNTETLFNSTFKDIASTDSINTGLAESIINSFSKLDQVKQKLESELKELNRLNSRIITFWDDEYPENLKKIYFPPIILYIKGELLKIDKNCISIVGTRKPSDYGKIQASRFSEQLASKGLTIVSGMARGIDSIAHHSALRKGGRTIAVIGSGINVIYPPENKKLFEEISENGAIISEFELSTKPDAPNFPRRNRIISGLSPGTLIIETKLIGGAMQTASHALDQNREVFAVPGNIDSKHSAGTNALIQKGEAKLVTNVDDILVELNLGLENSGQLKEKQKYVNLNMFEQSVLTTLSNNPKHIDDVADESGITAPECLVYLLNLELKGMVRQLPGKNFVLS